MTLVRFWSMAAREALSEDRRWCRRMKRWNPDGPPISLDIERPDDSDEDRWIAPSWSFGCDPLAVVIAHEALRGVLGGAEGERA